MPWTHHTTAGVKNQYQVESRSSKGGKFYTVTEYQDGNWACACMNWTRTFPRQDCKHILLKKVEIVSAGPGVSQPVASVRVAPITTGRKYR